jgi:hypothetical protein
MNDIISLTLLAHVSKLMTEGTALWGLLMVNEYGKSEAFLRRAMVAKARKSAPLQTQSCPEGLWDDVVAGKTLRELKPAHQEFVRLHTRQQHSNLGSSLEVARSRKPHRVTRRAREQLAARKMPFQRALSRHPRTLTGTFFHFPGQSTVKQGE